MRLAAFVVVSLALPVTAQDPPLVASLQPASGDVEVDPGITELVVTFDQPMSQQGFSFCGGGPQFPKTSGCHWKGARTCVMNVTLEPDHSYVLSLNCPAAQNFRSAKGVALAPTPWRFSTLPKELPPAREQRRGNEAALKELLEVLEGSYSYYDDRGLDWKKQVASHRDAILAAKTTRGWAAAVADMLAPTGDIHLYLRYRDDTFATGRRAVDPLFRSQLLSRYLKSITQVTDGVVAGRTEDDLGYLLVAGWPGDLDVAAIGKAIEGMRDTKGMIVDVRPNGGGDEMEAMAVAQWFVGGKRVYAKNRYRVRKGKDGFGPVLEREIEGVAADRRYPGPVVLLQSRYVISSNEAFVLMMRQGEKVTTVGQTTFGCSGNPKPHELRNGVTIVVPSWQAMRPDGTCFEGQGIAPDVEVDVKDGELDERDPILEKGLEVLRGKD